MKNQLIAGNWKMFMRRETAEKLTEAVVAGTAGRNDAEVVLCPPFVYLEAVSKNIGDSGIGLGAQDVYWETEGAFTGEVAPEMLRDVGCSHVIIAHSERRTLFNETDETARQKILAVLRCGLTPIYCVGETLAQRERGQTEKVVSTQLRGGLAGIEPEQLKGLVIAYEPVWAIGTGRTASPEQAEEVHALLADMLQDELRVAPDLGARIIYGGSVKADNAQAILAQAHVDGALVGGASLKAESFCAIIRASSKPGGKKK